MPRRPADTVSNRTLSAEAAASAALLLIQHHAVWEGLTTLALISETAEAQRHLGMHAVGQAICDVLDEMRISDEDADRAVQLMNTLDSTARTWAGLAHGAQPGGPRLGAACTPVNA